MIDGPTCTYETEPGWDQYVCKGLAVVGEGSDRSWLVSFDPPRTEMCVEFDQFRILLDDEDAKGYVFYGLKIVRSSLPNAGWTYAFHVEDSNSRNPSRAPVVRCRFSWLKQRK